MLSLSQQKKIELERRARANVKIDKSNIMERQAAARARKLNVPSIKQEDVDEATIEHNKHSSVDSTASDHDNELVSKARKHEKKLHDIIIDEIDPEEALLLATPRGFINPKDPRKTYWDLGLGVLIIASVIEVPWRIALEEPANDVGWLIWGYFIDIMFTLDIITNFRTGWINLDGEIVWDVGIIRNKYLKGWFTVDLLSTLPFDKIIVPFLDGGSNNNNSSVARSGKLLRILRIVRLLKLTRLLKMAKLFSKGDGTELLGQSTMDLIKMIVLVTFVGHLLACVFLMVANFQVLDTPHQWLTDSGVDKYESPWDKYLVAMYWAFTTMTTVGYGDVNASPTNIPEHIFVMIAMLIGTSIFGYFVGNITVIFEAFDIQASITKDKLERVRDYSRDRSLPEAIKRRLQKHFKYYYNTKGCFDTNSMFERMNDSLRDDMILDVEENQKIKKQFSSLFRQFDRSCQVSILENLEPAYLNEAEEAHIEGEHGTEIYFLRKGQIRVFCDDPNNVDVNGVLKRFSIELLHLKAGEIFGIDSVLSDVPYTTTAIGEDPISEIFFLKKEILTSLFYSWPHLHNALATMGVAQEQQIKKEKERAFGRLSNLSIQSATSNSNERSSTNTEKGGLEMVDVTNPMRASTFDEPLSPTTRKHTRQGSLSPKEFQAQLWREQKVIHPETVAKILWDIFQGVLIFWSVITVPLRLAFNIEATGGWLVANWVIDILFTMDIILNFYTAYFNGEGVLITDYKSIAKNYFKTWFFIDFFATFPLDQVIKAANNGQTSNAARSTKILRVLRLFRLFKLFRLLKLGSFFGKYEEMITINPAVIKLVKLFMAMTFVAHLKGCLFYGVADVLDTPIRSWPKEYFCPNIPYHSPTIRAANGTNFTVHNDLWMCFSAVGIETRYIAALYWAFTTMTTVGYGDISPELVSPSELIVTIIVQLLGTIVFAYVIGGVMNLVINYDPAARLKKQEMQLLDGFMQHAKYSRNRSRGVRRQFNYYIENKSIFRESEILYAAPHYIVRDVYNFLSEKSLSKVKILTYMERNNEGFIAFIFPFLHPVIVPKGKFVYRTGTYGRAMYFVVRGQCETVPGTQELEDGESTSTYNVGDHFGQVSLIIPDAISYTHRESVRATLDTTLVSLKRKTMFYLRELSDRSVSLFLKECAKDLNIRSKVKVQPDSHVEQIEQYVSSMMATAHEGGAGAMHKAIQKRASETVGITQDNIKILESSETDNEN